MIIMRGFLYLLFLQGLYFSHVEASPTSNEFLTCHKQASWIILDCLNKNPGYLNDTCWHTAKQANVKCYEEVIKSHSPQENDRIYAEKEAIKKYQHENLIGAPHAN